MSPAYEKPFKTVCIAHWTAHYGIFVDIENITTLCAYAKIRRCGNISYLLAFIGHGQHLSNGIMDRLHFEIIEWLCNSEYGKGLEYIMYGAAEHAGIGLMHWKSKHGYVPVLIDYNNR